MKVAYFGLPLGAVLLLADGHVFASCALPPMDAPGRRRIRRALGPEIVLDAKDLERAELERRVERRFQEGKPDLVVSWFWPRKLPRRLLDAARFGGVGVHPSLLPRHRGPDPFFWAIDSGDTLTGVSAHILTENYDDGAVLSQETLEVGARNAWQLARALDRPSLRLLRAVVAAHRSGAPPRGIPQDERLATWAPEPEGEAARVDLRWPSERVLRRVRALSPVPGVPISVRGVRLFVTGAARCVDYPRVLVAGESAVWGEPPRLVLVTGDGAVAVTEAELAGEEPRRIGPAEIAALVAARPPDVGPTG